jgi:hypothetical protein
MTGFDPYGATDIRVIKELERRITALEEQVRNVPGAPVTQASGPFFLPDTGAPATPSGGAILYASSGAAYAIDAGGNVRALSASGSAVPDPAYNLTNATSGYIQGQAQTVVDTLDHLYTAFMALKAVLEDIGVIGT